MHNTQRNQALTNDTATYLDAFVDTTSRDGSLLDAMIEQGVREPAKPSALDAMLAEPVAKYSRGRKLVVRHVEVARQDTDVQSVGGLFGAVDESAEPVAFLHGSQASLPMGAVQTDKSTGCCVCGDGRCNIGPFILTKSKGGR